MADTLSGKVLYRGCLGKIPLSWPSGNASPSWRSKRSGSLRSSAGTSASAGKPVTSGASGIGRKDGVGWRIGHAHRISRPSRKRNVGASGLCRCGAHIRIGGPRSCGSNSQAPWPAPAAQCAHRGALAASRRSGAGPAAAGAPWAGGPASGPDGAAAAPRSLDRRLQRLVPHGRRPAAGAADRARSAHALSAGHPALARSKRGGRPPGVHPDFPAMACRGRFGWIMELPSAGKVRWGLPG